MKIKIVNKDLYTEIDDEDYETVKKWNWHLSIDGYAVRTKYSREDGKERFLKIYLHNVIMGRKQGLQIDHINGNKLDNRKSNLRHCTASQNQVNFKRFNKYGYRGVRSNKGSYEASIAFQRKRYYSWGHKTVEEAARAYDKMAKELHGEFAMLNFP